MNGFSGPLVPRLSARQVLAWGLAFAVIVALVVFYFTDGRQVRPLLG